MESSGLPLRSCFSRKRGTTRVSHMTLIPGTRPSAVTTSAFSQTGARYGGSMPYGLSPEEIEWVRESYRMFREGDPAFMERYAPDARFSFPTTLPAGGTYEGPFEAMEYFTTLAEQFEGASPTPEEFLRVEDRLIVFGTFRGRSRQTGEEIALRFMHSLRTSGEGATLTEQKTVSFELFIDTAAVLRALGRSASGE